MNHLTRSILAICLAASVTTLSAADDPAKELGITYGLSLILPPYPRTRSMRNVALTHRAGFCAVDVA